MPYMIPQPQRVETAPYCFHKDLFSAEECKEMVALHKNLKKMEPLIGGSGPEGKLDKKKRSADLYWVNWQKEVEPLFSRIAVNVFASNQKWWNFNLAGLNEPLQLTHYKAKDKGHYDWHEDWGENAGFSHRKLSGIILLSDKFKGGEFELLHRGKIPELTVGSMVLFPSFRTHKVSPVTKGERWSLVFWVSGPPFA